MRPVAAAVSPTCWCKPRKAPSTPGTGPRAGSESTRPGLVAAVAPAAARAPVPALGGSATARRLSTPRRRCRRAVAADEPLRPARRMRPNRGLATLACVEAASDAGLHRQHQRRSRLGDPAARVDECRHGHRNACTGADPTFRRGRARNRRDNGPENLAILRRLALNLLTRLGPACPSSANASVQDGPTPSQEPSSAKCDNPGHLFGPDCSREPAPASCRRTPRRGEAVAWARPQLA